MKQKDVQISGEYMTLIGAELIKVRVISDREFSRGRGTCIRFVVRRVDNGKVLPKARTAAALRPVS